MPELPEVESTVQYLRERMLGLTITEAQVFWARSIDRPSHTMFTRQIPGYAVRDIVRRGKYIVMMLEKRGAESRFLLGHLRMSGSMDVVSESAPLGKHDRVVLTLDGGKQLRFNDPRKFGRFYLVAEAKEVLDKLGWEPLDDSLTAGNLFSAFQTKRGAIKPVLLDQTVIAGVGNIYADECLWRSSIHPLRSACSLSMLEVKKLLKELRCILREAIEANGTDFGDGVVYGGGYAPRIYGRDGEACHRCKGFIKRIVVGQRGTHFCPCCQPRRRIREKRANVR